MKPPRIKAPKVKAPKVKAPKVKGPKIKGPKAPKPPKKLKKLLIVLLPILLIIGALVLLYLFVLSDVVDPPPDQVTVEAIEAAQAYLNNGIEANQERFSSLFSERCREGLEREWRAIRLDGSPRGSWYELARGMLNEDGTKPEVVGVEYGEGGGEEEGEEEGGEEEEDEESSVATVRIIVDREEREIPFMRDNGLWRIHLPTHPPAWQSAEAAAQ